MCGNPICNKLKLHACAGCLKEKYCSSDCQKRDWKIHKIMCASMKNNDKFLPFTEVALIITKIKRQAELKEGTESEIRLLKYCILFAKYQYGSPVVGKSYRERDNGSQISNWNVELGTLLHLYLKLGTIHRQMNDIMDDYISTKNALETAIPYFRNALKLLEPWKAQIDVDETIRINDLNEDDIGHIYYQLSNVELNLSTLYISLEEYDKADDYCNLAISHARLVIIEDWRIESIYNALFAKGDSLYSQSRFIEAKAVCEEVYNFMVDIYYTDHPLVLHAANLMIRTITEIGEHKDSERYARISYECLTRPIDNESEVIADAAQTLAQVIHTLICSGEDGDIVEAEMLARKSLRIKEGIHGVNHSLTCTVKITLSNILQRKTGGNEERKSLLEQTLASFVKSEGDDGEFVARVNSGLACLHCDIADDLLPGNTRNGQLHIAVAYTKEAIRISSVRCGASHPKTVDYESKLIDIVELI
jgi:tetratricopeptide (TPR) repeat protein